MGKIYDFKLSLLDILLKANKRIYFKTFFLNEDIVEALINKKAIDIRVSIDNKIVNENYELIEVLFKNDILVSTHYEKEYLIIVDDEEFKLDYTEEKIKEDDLGVVIEYNFNKNSNLDDIENKVLQHRIDGLIKKIKDEFRLIDFSMSGIKIYNKQINFAKLLKGNSTHSIIADEEKFDFFDNKFIVKKIYESKGEEKNRYEALLKEYENLKELCTRISNLGKKIKERYSVGKFNRFNVINRKNIKSMTNEIKKISVKKSEIDIQIFNELIEVLYKNFEYKLHEVLKRHDIFLNEDVEAFKKSIKQSLPNGQKIIDDIQVNNFIIVEFSKEILCNIEDIGIIKRLSIDEEMKNTLVELELLLANVEKAVSRIKTSEK